MNVHLQVSRREYNALVRAAGRDARVQRTTDNSRELFATIPVVLFVSPDGKYSRYARAYDPTYSKTILDITQED